MCDLSSYPARGVVQHLVSSAQSSAVFQLLCGVENEKFLALIHGHEMLCRGCKQKKCFLMAPEAGLIQQQPLLL